MIKKYYSKKITINSLYCDSIKHISSDLAYTKEYNPAKSFLTGEFPIDELCSQSDCDVAEILGSHINSKKVLVDDIYMEGI